MKFIAFLILAFIFSPIIWLVAYVPIVGFHYEVSSGEHTGYITAVESSGLFFKTESAYLKTDTQSSQEDTYCVTDDKVYEQLKEYAKTKTFVNVYFVSWLSAGIMNCGTETATIYKVEPAVK